MANALRGVNFIPDEIIAERRQKSKLKKGNRIAIGLAVLSLLIGLGLLGYNYYSQSEIKNTENQIAESQKKIDELSDLGKTGYLLGLRLGNAQEILEERIYYSKLFEELTVQIPDSITVKSWQSSEAGSINLSGSSMPNYSPIATFENNLKSSETGIFEDVRLQSASLNTREGNVNFTVKIEINIDKLKESVGPKEEENAGGI